MEPKRVNLGLGGGKLLQVANRTLTQMMSYVIDTDDGGVIVIDGGEYNAADAENLYSLLCARGRKVDYWFITHAHSDHLGAMLYLMDNHRFDINVGALCFNFPSLEWLSAKEEFEFNSRFLERVKEYNLNVVTVKVGDVIKCGGISVEILSVPTDYEKYAKTINSTSIIFKVYFKNREVLFMGDFDVNAEDDYISKYDVAKLRTDILQMPHHGQNGISRDFYARIMPKICLYTAPDWLWENNKYKCQNPETRGKGPFTTLETRKWMDELGAEASYNFIDGDILFY